jgi:parallel beta-helix repeat protein
MTIYGGVAIAGSNNIIIHGNTIENSPNIGVWIGTTGTTQSGGGTYIDGNMIEGNAGDGIALNNTATTSTSSPSTTIYVTQNDIIQNGAHGIEVESNYITVSGNFVNTNGLTVGGTSGIHCLGSSTTPYTGNYNSITFNVTSNQEDNETGGNGQDGNGLEADGQTIGNVFVQNLSFGNDGAGIVLYDSASNSVSGNVTYGNGINHLGSHSYPGEFVILDDASLTKNNAAGTNVFLSDHATTAAVQFEVSTSFGNTFGGNYEENAASTEVYDLTGTKGNTLSYWNNTLHATDKFSGVTVKAPTGAYYYGFASGTKWTINGRTYTMAGWNASNGAIYGQ